MRRVTQISIDWGKIAERVPEAQKPLFAAFKSKSDTYLRKMMANPEAPPKIDWEYYRSRVPVKGMVDDFQKQYDALKIPFPTDTVSALIEAQEKEAAKELSDFIKASNARITNIKTELAKLEAVMPFELMTMEDFKDAFPEHAIDTLNKPTFWPHTPEEQLDYKPEGGEVAKAH